MMRLRRSASAAITASSNLTFGPDEEDDGEHSRKSDYSQIA
jgi:hypothetical protein